MTLAIEPMTTLGGPAVEVLRDGWTVVTQDRLPSAHFEHTVAVTEGEPEILTCRRVTPSVVEGVVVETLPNGTVRVEMPNGYRALGYVPGKKRAMFGPLVTGDKVIVGNDAV